MPSTYTLNLGLEKPATGEQAGTWGTTANNSYDFLDMGIDGNLAIALSSSAYTLLTNQGAASPGRNKICVFTGALTADGSVVIAPNTAQKIYYVINQTTGGHNLIFSQGTGPTFTLQPNCSAIIYASGAGATAGVQGVLSNFQCTTLTVGSITYTSPPAFTGAATFSGGVTISPSLILNLGSDAAYDMYYRSSGGGVARLPIGAAGQTLMATSSGPAWQTVPPTAVGTPITGAVAYQVFQANASAQLSQDANHIWVPGIGLGIGMSPSVALTVGGNLTPMIQMTGPATGPRSMTWATSGAGNRWAMALSLGAESGAFAGSNFLLACWDNSNNQYIALTGFRNTSITFGGITQYPAQVTVLNQIPSQDALRVIGAASQSGNLTIWYNSAGSVLAYIDSGGNYSVASGAVISSAGQFISAAGINTHGNIQARVYSAYDSGGFTRNGFTGQVSSPAGALNVVGGIIVSN